MLGNENWIWLDQPHEIPHQYVCFRKRVEFAEISHDDCVYISADSDFILYINGVETARGQWSDYPERKSYTRVPLGGLVYPGINTIAVLAYYRGEDFSEYRKGRPGLNLTARVGDALVVSDTSWRAIEHPAFTSGAMPRVTGQMGFTTCFDARRDIDWTSPDFADDSWTFVVRADGFSCEIVERPFPPLAMLTEPPARIAMQGSIRRTEAEGSFARIMSRDYLLTEDESQVFALPAPPAEYTAYPPSASDCIRQPDDMRLALNPGDRFVIFDLGRETVGLLTIHLDAPAGTVLDIAHGEHLDDGRVRMYVGGRNFADRYVCKEGENRFVLPFRRLGARYIEVHFTSFDRPVKLDYIGLKPLELPVDDMGDFTSNDYTACRAYDVAKRTLTLCMHEHYEDCPWREQSLYAFDSRNQALYGYYAFGNYDFAAASFDLLGRGIRDDGLLELCAPARVSVTIPAFSLVWITELAEHWLYSGSSDLFERYHEQIRFILDRATANYDGATGLYHAPSGEGIWQFYEWMDGLAGADDISNRLDAPYNLFLHESLGSYAWMLSESGRKEEATAVWARQRALGESIYNAFWQNDRSALATYLLDGRPAHYSDLVQVLALRQGVLPDAAIESLYAGNLYPMTLSSRLYEVLALMGHDPRSREFVERRIYDDWGYMLGKDATSFWETLLGGDDFGDAGSLCHGWSALPALYFGGYVLGIHPLSPGFERFAVRPYPGRLNMAEGSVPTPAGPIRVMWQRSDAGLVVRCSGPRTLQPQIDPLPEAPIAVLMWNGEET